MIYLDNSATTKPCEAAVEAMILDTYAKEKCPDAVKTTLDEKGLLVEIAYCPAVKHLLKTGREVTPWYRYSTEVVMEVMAEKCGCTCLFSFFNSCLFSFFLSLLSCFLCSLHCLNCV